MNASVGLRARRFRLYQVQARMAGKGAAFRSGLYSSNRSLVPLAFVGAIEASGICAALP
jgi:alpha-D-ribose 1-methylphosphonate 5-triphosphate synthase subunit PhnG